MVPGTENKQVLVKHRKRHVNYDLIEELNLNGPTTNEKRSNTENLEDGLGAGQDNPCADFEDVLDDSSTDERNFIRPFLGKNTKN